MRTNPDTKLSDDRNECPSCGCLFENSNAFDEHRVGKFRTPTKPTTRRCLTSQEMHDSGFRQNRYGFMMTEHDHKYDQSVLKPRMDMASTSNPET